MSNECEQRQQRRKDFAIRFLLANAGGLLALCAVMIQGGRIIQQVEHATDLARSAVAEQREMKVDINAVRLDMAEVKGVMRTHDKEIDNLQRGQNGIYNRKQ